MKTSLLSLALVALLAASRPASAAGQGQPMSIPDFTKGGTIPAGAQHDWNLGPTGLRGWMFCDKMVTTDARQISITKDEDPIVRSFNALALLASGDPAYLPLIKKVVRERAAMALARRNEVPIPPLLKMLESPALDSRYGACQALIALRGRGAPAIKTLRKSLAERDLWLRIKAAEALASIGPPAMQTVPELLELLAHVDKENDPRGMQQRYLSFS